MTTQEDCSLREITRIIQTDAAFAVEVLRLANSAILAMRYEVVSVMHAASVLGMERLKALVLTVGMRDMTVLAGQHSILSRCWRHNLACALAAEKLADAWWLDRSIAYTAGLLHDVGRLALVASHPQQYRGLLEQAGDQDHLLRKYEREAFGTDHMEAGAWVASEWGLGALLAEASQCHHAELADHYSSLRCVVGIACHAADRLGYGVTGPVVDWERGWLKDYLSEMGPKVAARIEEIHDEVPHRISLFESGFLA